MYHLFFGDGAGSPGSDMTVFDMPRAVRERRGNNSISRTTFRVGGAQALQYWAARLHEYDIPHSGVSVRNGRAVLEFDDFEGTQLALIDDGGVGLAFPWEHSPVPAPFQIRGLGYIEITVPALAPSDHFLTRALGLQEDHTYMVPEAPQYQVHVYTSGDGGAHAEVHVFVRDDLPRARYGAGGVHHVALRIPAGQQIEHWVERLNTAGYRNTGVVDRHYFTSAYVREPNGVLFELATDGPGFTVDHPLDGERLSLPPFLEARRAEIEAQLKPFSTVPAEQAAV